MNHYATDMYVDKAGRHYWFAKELEKYGHTVTIFCASDTAVNSNANVDIGNKIGKVLRDGKTDFVITKTNSYKANGLDRVKSFFCFYKNLFPVTRLYAKKHGKPDIIIASSVHPLTMVAGIKIGKKMKVPCICEIRDLWPEAIFSFGKAKEKSLIGMIMIKGEHWIYKNADALIFTKEGDTDYLKERKWTTNQGGDIDLKKCHYINNGVDNKAFQERIETVILDDMDLTNESSFNVTYAGTIRPVNNVGNILDAAKIIQKKEKYKDIKFLIFGDGSDLPELKKRVKNEHISNVKLKGQVEKKYIPYILSKSSINILNYSQNQYNWSRGNSSNKLFEYMASGKPIISTVHMGYSIINKYKCGVELDSDSAQCLAESIMKFHDMNKDEFEKIGLNGKKGAEDFDFTVLTQKLLYVINKVQNGGKHND